MTIGQRVAQKRKELSLSQEALGDALGVSRQSIYKWESDSALPEIDKLIALSRLFGVSVGWLLGVEELPRAGTPNAPEADGDASDPEGTADELTEAQLQMVEAIVERYTAALPKPLSSRRRKGFKLCIIAASLCLLGILYSLFGRLDALNQQYRTLQNNLVQVESSVDSQIGSVTGRIEDILKAQNSLAADYGVELVPTASSAKENRAVFSAHVVPKTYTEGTTVKFSVDNGTGGVAYAPGKPAPDGGFTATLACQLTDSIAVSVVFETPDGTRSTQLLDQFQGLYSGSLPVVELTDYGSGELLGLTADRYGRLTLPEVYVTVQPDPLFGGGKEPLGRSEAESVRVGLFQNRTLVVWLEPCQQPERFRGDYEGHTFYRLPDGTRTALVEDTDQLRFAAVVTDEYGREAVYGGVPYILSADGELTRPGSADLGDHDPSDWNY